MVFTNMAIQYVVNDSALQYLSQCDLKNFIKFSLVNDEIMCNIYKII